MNENDENLNQENFEAQKQQIQDEKFGKDSPLITILKQSFGPFIFQTISACQEAISLFFVTKAYSGDASLDLSSVLFIKTLLFSIDIFFTNGVTIQIAPLLSQKKTKIAGQLLADAIRVAIGIALLLFILFAALGKFLIQAVTKGDPNQTKYNYMLASASELVFVALYEMLNAVLMGEGRAILSTTLQMSALVFSLFIVDPIFMFGIHVPVWVNGFSPSLGKVILSIILLILFLKGKFSTELELRMFITRFTPESKTAIKVGLLPLCQMILGLIPTLIMQSTVASAVPEEDAKITSGIFGIGLKIYTIIIQSATGALSGLYGPVSWAFSKQMYERIKKMMYSSWILPLIPFLIICPIMVSKPSVLLKIWSNNDHALEIGNNVCKPMFYTSILFAFYQSITFTLLASTKSILSILALVSKAVVLIFGCIILGKVSSNPSACVYAFVAADCVALIVSIILLRFVGKVIWFEKEETDSDLDQLHAELV